MLNPHVVQRLAGIQTILNGVHQASAPLSTATKGNERQLFIDRFLANVLPPVYRFGTGDATDSNGGRTGQLDVVVEFPISPSLPGIAGAEGSRLYLAECIAAVVEVKSDVANQWPQAVQTAQQLSTLSRNFGGMMTMGGFSPGPQIPLFVVGYTGWKNMQSLQDHLAKNPNIAGILVIDAGLFASSQPYGGITATGPISLWGLIGALHLVTAGLKAASFDVFSYVR